MALSPLYFVTADLEETFINKDTGLPLANGTISFFRDAARTVPKEVFYLTGAPPYNSSSYVSLGYVVTLSAVGTVQNSGGDNEVIYYYPWITDPTDPDGPLLLDLYYISVKDSGGTEQFTREAWPNLTIEDTPEVGAENFITNQISNPTFTNVFINEGFTTTYTVTAATDLEFEFAPDWDFVISGTGTVVVQRLAITGSQQIVTNPPYVIDMVISSGVTKCHLRQRLPKNSGLWTSTTNRPVFLYGSFIAQNQVGGSAGIEMFYQESSGINATPILIVAGSFTNPYELQTGATTAPIPPSTNTNSGESGYIDIYLEFDTPSQVRFSSVQVIPSAISPVNQILPDLDSSNRNEAFQADYYLPRAAAKQIDSYLIGWDFPLNPRQFGASGSVTNTAAYIVDQTIAARGVLGSIAWSVDPITSGLHFVAGAVNDAFYIQQYLSGAEVKKMLGTRLSVNVFAYQNGVNDPVTMRVYLYRAPAASTIPVLPLALGTVAPTGVFTLTGPVIADNWKEIPRSGLDTAKATLNNVLTNDAINSNDNDYGFSGWEITDPTQIADTDKFAIVVTFTYVTVSSEIVVNSISLAPGDLPCRPAVKSFDDTLRECEYYYETSYNVGIVEGSITPIGSVIYETIFVATGNDVIQAAVTIYPRMIKVNFQAEKRIASALTFYPIDAATPALITMEIHNNNILAFTTNVSSTNWIITDNALSGYKLFPGNWSTPVFNAVASNPQGPSTLLNSQCFARFHYVADARLAKI